VTAPAVLLRGLSPTEAAIVASLDPLFQPLALQHRAACLAAGLPFTFTSGLRSFAEQGRLKAEPGRVTPAAPPGSSKHEVGFAYDFDGPRSAKEWLRAGELAEALGLRWGGRFTPKADNYHVEAPQSRGELFTFRLVKLAFLPLALVGVALLAQGKGKSNG
jgi:hypothetical protein